MQALGALRWTAPKSYPRSFSIRHQLSISPRSHILILSRNPAQTSPCIHLFQHRHFSLGSIFSRSKPTPTPSALTVATIARVETDANVSPHDVSKQLALFQALVDTNVKPGYDIVIARWERMCEFVRFCVSGPYPIHSFVRLRIHHLLYSSPIGLLNSTSPHYQKMGLNHP
jgi:hypothetical protein